MKIRSKLTLLIIISGMIFLFNAVPVFAAGSVWSEFVASPDEAKYMACSEAILDADAGLVKKEYASASETPVVGDLEDQGTFQKLVKLIREGNVYARHLGFELLPLLADESKFSVPLNAALGEQIKGNPEYFLTLVDHYSKRNGRASYEGVADTFGERFKGKPQERMMEAQARAGALRTVNKPELAELRDFFIGRLEGKPGKGGK